jgi:hypothetical protein
LVRIPIYKAIFINLNPERLTLWRYRLGGIKIRKTAMGINYLAKGIGLRA